MGSFNPDSEPARSALKNYIYQVIIVVAEDNFFIAKRKSQKGESAESSVFLPSFFATKPHPNAGIRSSVFFSLKAIKKNHRRTFGWREKSYDTICLQLLESASYYSNSRVAVLCVAEAKKKATFCHQTTID